MADYKEARKKMIADLKFLQEIGIVFESIDLSWKRDKKGKRLEYEDCPGRYHKDWTPKTPYGDRIMELSYDKTRNGSRIFTGEDYNLICVDVDNKGNTVPEFIQYKKENFPESTLTIKSGQKGYHYYYRLSEADRNFLKVIDFKGNQDGLFAEKGWKIDLKYKNGIVFGPTVFGEGEEMNIYKIIKSIEPIEMPQTLMRDLFKKYYCAGCEDIRISVGPSFKCKGKYHKDTDGHYLYSKNGKDLDYWICNECYEDAEYEACKICPIKETKKEEEKDDFTIPQIIEKKKVSNKLVRILFDCLDEKRFNRYDYWFRIGSIIYNEGLDFDLFDEFSRRSNSYDKDECKKKWIEYGKNKGQKSTIGTLIYMAKEDNPQEAKEAIKSIKSQKASNAFDIFYSEELSNDSVANVYFSTYPTKYTYDIDTKTWYMVNKYGIYRPQQSEMVPAKAHISFKFKPVVSEDYHRRMKSIKDNKEREHVTTQYCKLIKNLGNEKPLRDMIDSMKKFYGQNKVYERMDDANRYAIGFTNGIYDLKNKEFRRAYPEEMISATTRYKYDDPNEDYVHKVESIINDIFPIEEEREYVMKTVSLCLLGSNLLEEFYIWMGLSQNSGKGSNGKGLLWSMLKNALGDYCGTLDIDYFLASKYGQSSDRATPGLANCKNARVVFIDEVPENAVLKESKIKSLAGRAPQTARALYQQTFTFIPKFKMIFLTNSAPGVDGSDEAVARRLRYIRFRVRFVDNPDDEYERKVDRNLKDEIDNDRDNDFGLALFHILLTYYNKFSFKENGDIIGKIEVPDSIKNETDEYLAENDPIKEFLCASTIITKNKTDTIGAKELYASYLEFHLGDNKGVSIQKFHQVLKGTYKLTDKRANTGKRWEGIKKKDEIDPKVLEI